MLWVRSADLTVPVELADARIYLLPLAAEGAPADAPMERIYWNGLAALSEGASVYVGGRARLDGGRVRFRSDAAPLLVILYDGPAEAVLERTVLAGRQRNEYWNPLTPFGLALGIFSELLFASFYAGRPAYAFTVLTALTAAAGPLLPLLPPGLALTVLYGRWWNLARQERAWRDLVALPLRHLPSGASARLPDGSLYVVVDTEAPPGGPGFAGLRLLAPPGAPPETDGWRCYGQAGPDGGLPVAPSDPTAIFAAVPGDPDRLSRRYSRRARLLEIGSALAALAGIVLNAALALTVFRFLV